MWFQAVVAAGDNDARLCGNWGVLFDEDYSLPSTKKRNKSGCNVFRASGTTWFEIRRRRSEYFPAVDSKLFQPKLNQTGKNKLLLLPGSWLRMHLNQTLRSEREREKLLAEWGLRVCNLIELPNHQRDPDPPKFLHLKLAPSVQWLRLSRREFWNSLAQSNSSLGQCIFIKGI
jgi:hypothetical protein